MSARRSLLVPESRFTSHTRGYAGRKLDEDKFVFFGLVFAASVCRLSHHPVFIESKDYNHGNEFRERLGFHFLHDAPAVFLDGALGNP
jgi:hypothetical protein